MVVGDLLAAAEIVGYVVAACQALASKLRENKQHKYICDRIATQVELLRSTMEGFPKPVDISVQPTLNELQGVLHNCCTNLGNGMASLGALQSIESEITSCLASLSLAHMQMHARHIHRLERSLSQIDRSLSDVLSKSKFQSAEPASDARMQRVEEMLLMVTQQLQHLHAKVDATQQPLQYELTPPTFRSFESEAIEVLRFSASDNGQLVAESPSSSPRQAQVMEPTGTEVMVPPLSPLSIRSYSGDISMAAIPPPSPAFSSTSQDSNLSGPPSSDILVEFSHAISNIISKLDARRRRGVSRLLNLVSTSVQSGNPVILEGIANAEQNRSAVTMIWKHLPNQSKDCFGDFVESCASLFALLSEHLPEEAKTMFLEEASSHHWQKLSALLSAPDGRNSHIRIAAAGVLFQMCCFNNIRSMLLEKPGLIESCMRLCVSAPTVEETQAAKKALTALAFPPGGGSEDSYIQALMHLTHHGKVDSRAAAIRTLSQQLSKQGCNRTDIRSTAALLVQLLCGSTAASQADAVQQALCSALCLLFEADADAVLGAVDGLQTRSSLLRLIVMDAPDAVQLFARIVERCSDATRQELCKLGAIDTIIEHWLQCRNDSQIWLLRGLLHLAPCNACRGSMTGIAGVPCFAGLPLLLRCADDSGIHACDALKAIVQLAKSPSSCSHNRSYLLEGESLHVLVGLLNSKRHIDERMAAAAVLVAIGEDPQAASIGRHLQAEAVFNLLASLHPSDRDADRDIVLQLVARLELVDEANLDLKPIISLFTQAAAPFADSKVKFAAVQLLKVLSAHNGLCRVLVMQHLRVVLQMVSSVCRAFPSEVTLSLCQLTRSPDAAMGLESCDHATINTLRLVVFDTELASNEDTSMLSAMLLTSACNLMRIERFAITVQLADEMVLLRALNSTHCAAACAAIQALIAHNASIKVFAVNPEVATSAFIDVLCSTVDVSTSNAAVFCLLACMEQRSEAVALVASSSSILQASVRAYHAATSVETRRMVLSMLWTLVHQCFSMPHASDHIVNRMCQDSGVLALLVDAFKAEDSTACLAINIFLKLAHECDAHGMVFLRSSFNAREGGPRLLDKISAFVNSSLSQAAALPEQVRLAVSVLYAMAVIQNQDHGADQPANVAQREATCNQCNMAPGGVESLARVLQFGVESVYGSVDGGQLLRGVLGILYSLMKLAPTTLARMRRAVIDKAETGGLFYYVMLCLAQLLMDTPRAPDDPLVGAEHVLAILHRELKDEMAMLQLSAQPCIFKVLARGVGLNDDRGRCYAVDLLMQVVHVRLDSVPKNQKSAARSSIRKELQECQMQACVQKLIALSGTQSRNSGRFCSEYFDKQRVW